MLKKFFLFVLVISFGISLLIFKSYNYKSYTSFNRNDRENEESPEKKKQTAIERSEYFFSILRDPKTNSIPVNIREKEIEFASRLPKSEERLAKGLNALAFNWKEAGPFDLGGRTRAIAVDLSDGTNKTIIAGGVSGGIWKSTDKGLTWTFKSSKTSILSVTSIAQDPRPGFQNYWYAVGGEFDGNSARSRGGGANYYGGGFYKSTDNGETWNSVSTNLTAPNGISWNSMFSYASKVIVSPTSGNVFVCSNAGVILKSTDRGSSWSTILGQQYDHYYTDLIINKNGVMVSYLSQLNQDGINLTAPGLFKSLDDGSNWINITPVDFPTSYSRSVMAFGTSNPNVIYTLTNTGLKQKLNSKKDSVNLFKIDISAGVSNDLSANLPDYTGTREGYMDTQNDYNMTIAVHPNNENIVFIGGTNLFRSFDGFATKLISPTNDAKINWIGGYGYVQSFFYPGLHPDIHTIVFDQNDGIWVGHDGGISYAPDPTTTNYSTFFPWVDRDNYYNVTQYYTMAISPTSGDTRIFGGAQDNGSPFFRWDGTNASNSNDVTTGDGAYSYIGSQVLNYNYYSYGSSQNGKVYRFGTFNTGDINENNWSEVTPTDATGMKFVNPYAVDPSNEDYMYYLAGSILWRNSSLSTIPAYQNKTSQGWSSIDLQIPAGYTFSTLAVSKTIANVLYLAAYSSIAQPKIYKMSNSKTATTVTEITPVYSTSAVPNGSYIHGIAINPDNADEVLVVISNYGVKSLWYTSNGGSSWSDVEGNFSVPSIRSATILPTSGNNKVYLIATSVGVYSSSQMNGTGTVWTQEGSNVIGNVVVEYITSRKSDGTVVAATHGRGAFVGKYIPTGIENVSSIPNDFKLEQNYPNPFNPTTVISYQLASPSTSRSGLSAVSDVKLKVYDALGKKVATLVDGKMEAGNHKIEFNASKLASGVYIYRLESKDFVSAKKMILIK